jgi:hypothetical protein
MRHLLRDLLCCHPAQCIVCSMTALWPGPLSTWPLLGCRSEVWARRMRFVLDPTALEEEASHLTASLVHQGSVLVFASVHMPRAGASLDDVLDALAPSTSLEASVQREREHGSILQKQIKKPGVRTRVIRACGCSTPSRWSVPPPSLPFANAVTLGRQWMWCNNGCSIHEAVRLSRPKSRRSSLRTPWV